MFRLLRTLRRSRASIVHLHTCSGFSFFRSGLDLFIARLCGCRTALHVHGAMFDAFYEHEPRPRKSIVRWILTSADRVVVLSATWRERLRTIAPSANLVVIENAVEVPKPVADSAYRNGPCHFVLLARMDNWKGIVVLLDACAILHGRGVRFRMTLAGPPGTAGDDAAFARNLANRGLAETCRYVGTVLGREKSALLASADVYVQPSHYEGMPIAVLEALAVGLPVVATRVGAIPEVIEHGRQGLLVSAHDPAALASAMQTLAEGEELRATMARESRALAASRFSIERFRDDLADLYAAMIDWPVHTSSNRVLRSDDRSACGFQSGEATVPCDGAPVASATQL
jgi:glycosyltransferase involved in cell wall biosynthesis